MRELNNKYTNKNNDKKTSVKERLRRFISQVKSLKGDPRYIAKGMAIGVFVGVTPTIPFHTVTALFLSFILNGSKLAAAAGAWVCNPLTLPFFYYGSYKVGTYLFGLSEPFDPTYVTLTKLIKMGAGLTLAMIMGGVIIGFPISIITYFITLKIFTKIRGRQKGNRNIK
jgi:uncharacterized protein (DUF2062 family)